MRDSISRSYLMQLLEGVINDRPAGSDGKHQISAEALLKVVKFLPTVKIKTESEAKDE